MSAIAGVFHRDGRPAQAHQLYAMLARQARRGPDGQGVWTLGPLGLGQRQFWNTPEARLERQPLVHSSGQLALVADARIDNRSELISALTWQDRDPRAITDADLILAAYLHWGERCTDHLAGDFAFALWDARSQSLFCARDPMGIKPLYYYSDARLFAFASEVQPILCLPEAPRKLNELRVADHLVFNLEDRRPTFFEGIFQLAAGHNLTAGLNHTRTWSSWELPAGHTLRLGSDREYSEAFLEKFEEAVRCRLRSYGPVGSQLSGGLDSSSIVAVAARLLESSDSDPLRTYSAVFPGLVQQFPRIEERPWIDQVVAQGRVQAHQVQADCLDPLEALDITDDEPVPVPNMWLNWGSFREARQSGVLTMLSGVDGDTAISYGHGYMAELATSFRWVRLATEARALAKRTRRPLRSILHEYGLTYLAPPAAKRAWAALRSRRDSLPFEVPYNPAFARRVGLEERVRAAGEQETWIPRNTARELHRQSLRSGMVLYMPELVDKTAAATGVEARLPFFDRRLLEFLVSLPTEQKLRRGWNRYILRNAMQGLLPGDVQWRTSKGDLRANVRRGLFESRGRLQASLFGQAQAIEAYLDRARLKAAFQRFVANPLASTEADVFTILIAYTLAQFLRKAGFSE